jgi:hypothetical protein
MQDAARLFDSRWRHGKPKVRHNGTDWKDDRQTFEDKPIDEERLDSSCSLHRDERMQRIDIELFETAGWENSLPEKVRRLLSVGADVNAKDHIRFGWTPLQFAC